MTYLGSLIKIFHIKRLEHTDIYELVKTMSIEQAKAITESGIDNLNKYLKDELKLDLDNRNDWSQFREFFYRRNIVVHNYGVPDTTYITETKSNANKRDWLEINDQYISTALSMFGTYAHDIMHFFGEKYGRETGSNPT